MKTYKKLIISCLAVLAILSFAGTTQAVTLNQTSVSLSTGQSVTVYASNIVSYLYVSSNSNPNMATVSISGNVISIYGNSVGSSTILFCQNNASSSCATLYVTVGSSGYYNNTGNILSLTNLTLSTGSSVTISPSNNYNYSYYNNTTGLYVSSNSNPAVATATASSVISGCYAGALYSINTGQLCSGSSSNNSSGSITITAVSPGSDTISLCQSGGTCSTIYVTVAGYTTPVNSTYYYGNESSSTSGIPVIYSTSSAN